MRTHMCGSPRETDIGQRVTLCGWVARRREHGEHLAFVDLRDHTGIVQCVLNSDVDVRSEYVVRVSGVVRERPDGTRNDALPTGAVEIGECEVEILRSATPPPFPIDERADSVDENVRLQYRYLDLRRTRMQRNLRIRSAVNAAVRRSMESQGFVEVETPMLVPSTPEGAREFLVPSRKEQGSFYALPQSPQLFKQLLMVGGVDRYYQIARCLRDEDLRADRQYEFMQLDLEMSFVGQDDVLDAVGRSVLDAAEAVTGERPPEIERMTWHEAMDRYGSDKPDLRFGLELVDLGDVFSATEFKAFASASTIKGIRVPGAAAEYGRGQLDRLTDRAKQAGAKGLVWLKVGDGGELESPVAKFLSPEECAGLAKELEAESGDLLLLVADEWSVACEVLGTLRNDLGRPPVHQGPYRYVWVVEFPLFVGVDPVSGRPRPGHHPFTRPHPDDVDLAWLTDRAHDGELLGILLAEHSDMRRHDLEQSEHHRRDSREVPRPVLTLEAVGDRARVDRRGSSLRVDLGDTRREDGVDALSLTGREVRGEIPRVGVKIGGPIELGRIHKDRDDDPVSASERLADQYDVSSMEGAHRWNDGDGVSLGDPRPRERGHLLRGRADRQLSHRPPRVRGRGKPARRCGIRLRAPRPSTRGRRSRRRL